MKSISLLLLILICLMISGCFKTMDGMIVSPTKKFGVIVTVNTTDESEPDYLYLIHHIYDRNGQEQYSIDSNASDVHKWAIGWTSEGDTLIMYSSDIGSYAWKIEKETFTEVEMSWNMHRIADKLYETKYNKKSPTGPKYN